ncbi:hypothetical protein ABPG72_020342, partial [Tetrahymena utriculariae]
MMKQNKEYYKLEDFLNSSLQTHTHLYIDLSNNEIDDAGALGLGSALAQCNNLSNLALELFGNKIGEAGASGLGSALAQCTNLSNLTLNLGSQIFEQAQNKLFSNAVCQIINQEKKQSALISYSVNHYNPQDLNSKSQQSQQYIQISITSQRENASITKNILVYSYQQAVNWSPSILEVHNNNQNTSQEQIQQKQIESNDLKFEKILFLFNDKTKLQNIIHQALLLVEQLQKLLLQIHKIFQRLLSMTVQSQKVLGQHTKTETQRNNVSENMQEQPHDILEQISKIPKHHLISLQCQNYQELPKQPQLDIQFEDEFNFNQFELEVQKRVIKNDRNEPKNLISGFNQ